MTDLVQIRNLIRSNAAAPASLCPIPHRHGAGAGRTMHLSASPLRRPESKLPHEPEARFLHRCLSTRRDEPDCLEDIWGQSKSCRERSAGVGRQLAESPEHTPGGRCRAQYRRHAARHGVIRRSTVSNSLPQISSTTLAPKMVWRS